MVVEFAIGLLGAAPFVSLLAIWRHRNPTRTAAVGHVGVAMAVAVAVMIAIAAAVGLERPSPVVVLPLVIAGGVVGMSAKQRGFIRPGRSDDTSTE